MTWIPTPTRARSMQLQYRKDVLQLHFSASCVVLQINTTRMLHYSILYSVNILSKSKRILIFNHWFINLEYFDLSTSSIRNCLPRCYWHWSTDCWTHISWSFFNQAINLISLKQFDSNSGALWWHLVVSPMDINCHLLVSYNDSHSGCLNYYCIKPWFYQYTQCYSNS